MYKQCKTCGKTLPIEKFWLQPNKKNRFSSCPQCMNKQRQDKFKLDEEKYKQRREKYTLKSRYSLSKENVNTILTNQKNCCAICGNILEKYHIDHDHNTGKIRGILCPLCNKGLGFFKDNISSLKNAVNYLEISVGPNMKDLVEI